MQETYKERKTLFTRINNWRVKNVTDRQFTLVLSFFVGLFAAIAAFLLHGLIRYKQRYSAQLHIIDLKHTERRAFFIICVY